MRIKGFKKKYKDHIVEINDMESNQRVLLIKGQNGSGKSTLLKAISGLINHIGEIRFIGTFSYMNERIKFPNDMTVEDVITAFNRMDISSEEYIYNLIDQFDLTNKIKEQVSALSKGMQMKLQLICALMIDRDIYILDEPFSGLDQASVIKLVSFINNSPKKFIIASHLDIQFKKDCDVIHL